MRVCFQVNRVEQVVSSSDRKVFNLSRSFYSVSSFSTHLLKTEERDIVLLNAARIVVEVKWNVSRERSVDISIFRHYFQVALFLLSFFFVFSSSHSLLSLSPFLSPSPFFIFFFQRG
jgi:hypothetical protein